MRMRMPILITAVVAALAWVGTASGFNRTFDAGTGALTVNATGDSEPITIDCSGGNVEINSGVLVPNIACAAVVTIVVNGASGPNAINLSAIAPSGAPFGALTSTTLNGGDGADGLTGSGRNDTLSGGAGADELIGGSGDDVLAGGTGNDTYPFASTAAAQTDTMVELPGEGTDLVDLGALPAGAPATVNLSSDAETVKHEVRVVKTGAAGQAANFENVTGGDGADSLTGNGVANVLDGGAGNDALAGGDGADRLGGGGGNDGLAGGLGSDTYEFPTPAAAETDTIAELAEVGDDTLDFSGLGGSEPVLIDLTTATTALGSHGVAPATRTLALGAAGQAAFIESVIGGPANDTITGNAAANRIVGGVGNDLLNGREGIDTLEGGPGSDSLNGSSGDDTYVFRSASAAETDTVVEAPAEGDDRLDFGAIGDALSVNLASADVNVAAHLNRSVVVPAAGQAAHLEDVTGGVNNDTIVGNGSANDLVGKEGQDAITGGDGNDILAGEKDNDTLIGGRGNDLYRLDVINLATEVDTVAENPGEGTDKLDFDGLSTAQPLAVNLSAADQTLATIGQAKVLTQAAGQALNIEEVEGGAANDTITGNPGANVLQGRDGNDTIVGLGGDDTLRGGIGSDRLEGRGGDDVYLFGPVPGTNVETDTIAEANGSGVDLLSFVDLDADDRVVVTLSSATTALATHRLRTIVTVGNKQALNFEEVVGGDGNDELVGNSRPNFLVGGQGDDVIRGAGGIDVLRGQSGNDTIDGGGEDDSIDGGAGNNRLLGGPGNDKLLAGIGLDVIEGGEGDDALFGGAGADRLLGGLGRDLMDGSIGNDVLLARDGSSDNVKGGPGTDRGRVDRFDRRRGIESQI